MHRDRRARLTCRYLLAALAPVVTGGAGGSGHSPDAQTTSFIPVPEIDVDPNSGTTLGIIATWLQTDEQGDVRRIIAPDVIQTQDFGYGARARVFGYPSEDTQWSVIGGAKQRVESEFAAQLETGRLRGDRWYFLGHAIYDRSGTQRFYGIGNDSRREEQTVYTDQQEFVDATLGFNLNHAWRIAYTALVRKVKIRPGQLRGLASIEQRFPDLPGIGITHEVLSRLSINYDTRNELTAPTRGVAVALYGGVAGRSGWSTSSMFTEVGADARAFWSPTTLMTWAAHVGLRRMPAGTNPPFWALSSIGGAQSVIGGVQTLRGFGTSRFYDRDAIAANLEMRTHVGSVNAVSTHIDLEIAPFVDVGAVSPRLSPKDLSRLHRVYGVGLRGIARPTVVAYLDLGVGTEGLAVFTGLDYPF